MKRKINLELDAETVERLIKQQLYSDGDMAKCVDVALRRHVDGECDALHWECRFVVSELRKNLGTILRGLVGVAEHLNDTAPAALDDEARQHFTRLRRSTRRSIDYANGLADYVDALVREIRAEEVDLTEEAIRIGAELQQAEPERQVRWWIAGDMKLRGSRILVTRLLRELLENAWKYTSVLESAGIAVYSQDADFVIEDNGIGFRQSEAESTFLVGNCLHQPPQLCGVGFGLAIAKRIVERHGGSIRAEGVPDKGARLIFNFGVSPPASAVDRLASG